eukprot:TRINITY_DN5856_c0_g1_i1.p1 TRINITY_DN5856_c0_g1~~TRINITY_DN5856_c0_g1_i1.p1  ORF type:complete len:301 (+),score=60.77 TRINITY_DN5856_c0_g1_i1:188-1090(+)
MSTETVADQSEIPSPTLSKLDISQNPYDIFFNWNDDDEDLTHYYDTQTPTPKSSHKPTSQIDEVSLDCFTESSPPLEGDNEPPDQQLEERSQPPCSVKVAFSAPSGSSKLPSRWIEYPVNGQNVYFNFLTEELTPEHPIQQAQRVIWEEKSDDPSTNTVSEIISMPFSTEDWMDFLSLREDLEHDLSSEPVIIPNPQREGYNFKCPVPTCTKQYFARSTSPLPSAFTHHRSSHAKIVCLCCVRMNYLKKVGLKKFTLGYSPKSRQVERGLFSSRQAFKVHWTRYHQRNRPTKTRSCGKDG